MHSRNVSNALRKLAAAMYQDDNGNWVNENAEIDKDIERQDAENTAEREMLESMQPEGRWKYEQQRLAEEAANGSRNLKDSDFIDPSTGRFSPSRARAYLRAGGRLLDDSKDSLIYGGAGLGLGGLIGALIARKHRLLGGGIGALAGLGLGLGSKYLIDNYGDRAVNWVKRKYNA